MNGIHSSIHSYLAAGLPHHLPMNVAAIGLKPIDLVIYLEAWLETAPFEYFAAGERGCEIRNWSVVTQILSGDPLEAVAATEGLETAKAGDIILQCATQFWKDVRRGWLHEMVRIPADVRVRWSTFELLYWPRPMTIDLAKLQNLWERDGH